MQSTNQFITEKKEGLLPQLQTPSSQIPTTYHVYFHPKLQGRFLWTGLIMQSHPRCMASPSTGDFLLSATDAFVYSLMPAPEGKSLRAVFKNGLKKAHERFFIKAPQLLDEELTAVAADWSADPRIRGKMVVTSLLGGLQLDYRGFNIPLTGLGFGLPTFQYGNIPFQIKRTAQYVDPVIQEESDIPRKYNKTWYRNVHFKLVCLMAIDQFGNKVDPKGIHVATFSDCYKPTNGRRREPPKEVKIGRINFHEEASQRVFGTGWQQNSVVETLLFVFAVYLNTVIHRPPSSGSSHGDSGFSGGSSGGGISSGGGGCSSGGCD